MTLEAYTLIVSADSSCVTCCGGPDPGGTVDCNDCNPEELMPATLSFPVTLCGHVYSITLTQSIDGDNVCRWTGGPVLLCGTDTLSDGAVRITLSDVLLYCNGTDFVLGFGITYSYGGVGRFGLQWFDIYAPAFSSDSTNTDPSSSDPIEIVLVIDSFAPFHATATIADITVPPAFTTPPVSDSPDAVTAFLACLAALGCDGDYSLTGVISA